MKKELNSFIFDILKKEMKKRNVNLEKSPKVYSELIDISNQATHDLERILDDEILRCLNFNDLSS